MHRRLSLLLSLCLPLLLHAQPDSGKAWSTALGLNYLPGRIIIHTGKIHIDAPPLSQAAEFSWTRQSLGGKAWQQRFAFPEAGLNLAMVHYGSRQTGQAIGFYPSISFRILGSQRLQWKFKVGGGLGIATRPWQRLPSEDTLNNVIGSRLNNFTMVQSGLHWAFHPAWSLNAGLHFYHLSNAATRPPNYGFNVLGAYAGLQFRPDRERPAPVKHAWPKEKNRLQLGMRLAWSMAEARPADGPLYPYYHASLFAAQIYRNKSRVLLGADATYSAELYALLRNNDRFPGQERWKAIRYSVFGGHEFVFGKVGLPLQYGIYLNSPAGGRRAYQKLGLTWHVYRNDERRFKDCFLFTHLVTELVNAQYAELGIGFML
jgi:hypothetical protein